MDAYTAAARPYPMAMSQSMQQQQQQQRMIVQQQQQQPPQGNGVQQLLAIGPSMVSKRILVRVAQVSGGCICVCGVVWCVCVHVHLRVHVFGCVLVCVCVPWCAR